MVMITGIGVFFSSFCVWALNALQTRRLATALSSHDLCSLREDYASRFSNQTFST
jgi:hypothetical protein